MVEVGQVPRQLGLYRVLNVDVPVRVAVGKVFVVDHDERARGALAKYLTASGFAVSVFGSAESLLEKHPTGPACVVADHCLPGLSGPELQKRLGESALSVVFVAAGSDVPTVVQAMKGGAVDFLTKPVDTEQLVAAVTRGLARSARSQVERRLHELFVERTRRLTSRERQVAAGLIRGLSSKEIAAELGTAVKTVTVQRARVMEKLEVSSIAELVRVVENERRSFVAPLLSRDPAPAFSQDRVPETRRVHSSGPQPKWRSAC
jgi:FixJ family two-component response regulator